ncbi:81_t:CDS:2, partial [Entrophospora sp. SA101]
IDIFKKVINGITAKQSCIIHGPYQSGKTSLLLEIRSLLMGERKNFVYFDMTTVTRITKPTESRRSQDLQNENFKIISYYFFKETLTDKLLNVAKDFFRSISISENLIYIGVGTSKLMDLMDDDGKGDEECSEDLNPPFNKAKFIKMEPFNVEEMGMLFSSYEKRFNPEGVPIYLQNKIIQESCGHPVSFMILLKLFNDFSPDSETS